MTTLGPFQPSYIQPMPVLYFQRGRLLVRVALNSIIVNLQKYYR